ncbi:MAG: FAD:protein FMN transferase [Phycisphaerae bacterium]|nr:FAD:protein FMN transferase [Phycisphaerae bacterium]
MGVQARLVVYAPDEPAATEAMSAAHSELARLDSILSDYRPLSDVSRLGREAPHWVEIDAALAAVLSEAARVRGWVGARFDVTVGPATRLWREARRTGSPPSEAAVAEARALIGADRLELDGAGRARLRDRGMLVDLGGIAKGFGAQRAVSVLRQRGLPICLVALAGDIAAGDPPPGETGWRVEIAPWRDVPGRLLLLSNACVSTSGDEEQFTTADGVRRSHIIDPRTALGVPGRSAATALSTNGAIADAVATALCVDGTEVHRLLEAAQAGEPALAWIVFGPGGDMRITDPSGLIRWAPAKNGDHR